MTGCQSKVRIKCGFLYRYFPCGKCDYCINKKKEVYNEIQTKKKKFSRPSKLKEA